MNPTKIGESFDFHRMKAELFSEIIQKVNGIFEERDAALYGLERDQKIREQIPQQRIMGELKKQEIMLQGKIKELASVLESVSTRLEHNQQHFDNVRKSLENMGEQLSRQASQMSKDLQVARELALEHGIQFKKNHTRFTQSLRASQIEWNVNYTNVNLQLNEHLRRLCDAQAKIKSLTLSSEAQFTKISSMDALLEDAGEKVMQHHVEVKKFVNVQRQVERLTVDSGTSSQKLRQLENFIDKYEPIYNYVQISEALYTVLDDIGRRRLQVLDKQILSEFTFVTSNDRGIPNLRLKVIKYRDLLNHIITRNKPYEDIPAVKQTNLERAQNIYEAKIEKQMSEFYQKVNIHLQNIEADLKKKHFEVNNKLFNQLNQNTQMVNFRILKTEDKIERLNDELRKAVQQASERILAEAIRQKPPTQEQQINFKFQELTKKIRNTPKFSSRPNRGCQTQRYSGLHQIRDTSELSKPNISISTLLPGSIMQIRRKSLIDMRRTSVTKK